MKVNMNIDELLIIHSALTKLQDKKNESEIKPIKKKIFNKIAEM